MVGGCDLSLTDGVCDSGQCTELGCVTLGETTYRKNCFYVQDHPKVWKGG